MRVIHEVGKYISIERGGIERLRYNYPLVHDANPVAPKPFLHPIRTPDGIEMTARSPIDHFWQRGLWFAFKYLNGINYWEENQEVVGRQVARKCPEIESGDSFVRWKHEVRWCDPQKADRLMEVREICVNFQDEESVRLDWSSRFLVHGREPLVLDRTPYTTWGGYGGLYVRMTQALRKQRIILSGGMPDDEPTGTAHAVGSHHRWGGIEGQLDTDFDAGEKWGAFVFFPSPLNFSPKQRFPEPFYGDAKDGYNFFGPAPLFHEPFTIDGFLPGYEARVLILSRRIDRAEVEEQYHNWMEKFGGDSALLKEHHPHE